MDYKFLVDTLGSLTALFLFGLFGAYIIGNTAQIYISYIWGIGIGAVMTSVIFGLFGQNVSESEND